MITRLILSNEYNTTRHTGKPGPKTLGPWDPQVGPSSETLKWDPSSETLKWDPINLYKLCSNIAMMTQQKYNMFFHLGRFIEFSSITYIT